MRHLITWLLTAFIGALVWLWPAPAAAQSERRLPEVLEAADLAWGARRYADALAGYEEVVRHDSTAARALFRLATLLAWRNDLDRAIQLFGAYRRLVPGDDDGRIALARTLAWRGRYDQAIAMYDSVLAGTPRHREAALGAAQALAWSGRLDGAIDRYEQWVRESPTDADAWVSLAQAWRWAGRPRAARHALRRALEAQPAHADALAQLRLVDAALAPSLEPAILSTNDSDDNRSTTYLVQAGLAAPWSARLVLGASYRAAESAAMRGTALTARAATSWAPAGGAWTVRGEVGVTQLDGRAAPGASHASRTEPLASARVSGRVARRLSLGAGVTRAAFDETAGLILAGIATTAMEGDAELALRPRLTLSAGGGVTRLAGGSAPNRRAAASGALRWALARGVSVAAGARSFGYRRAAGDGYFAPTRYLLAEGSLRLGFGGELGWGLDADLGAGRQTVTPFGDAGASRFAQRASAVLAYRPAPGVEWSVGAGFANVASPTTVGAAEYRAWSVSLRGRVRL